jgi:hypothetical protein
MGSGRPHWRTEIASATMGVQDEVTKEHRHLPREVNLVGASFGLASDDGAIALL